MTIHLWDEFDMKDQREFERDRKLIEQDNAEPPRRDIHAGDHFVIIAVIALISFYVGCVYGQASGSSESVPAIAAAAHADY